MHPAGMPSRGYVTVKCALFEVVTPFRVAVTTTSQEPGVVLVPTFQVQDTPPLPSALLSYSPAASLGPDL